MVAACNLKNKINTRETVMTEKNSVRIDRQRHPVADWRHP
jgi:hypothetical protein